MQCYLSECYMPGRLRTHVLNTIAHRTCKRSENDQHLDAIQTGWGGQANKQLEAIQMGGGQASNQPTKQTNNQTRNRQQTDNNEQHRNGLATMRTYQVITTDSI